MSSYAQSFRLWYANNISDVVNLDEVEDDDSGLQWRVIEGGSTVSMGGNLDEVNKIKTMLASTRMKNLDDKRMFWKMRDHGLLCFKIEDLDGLHHTYEVIVNSGTDSISQTVDDFFFVNAPAPHNEIPYEVTVKRVDTEETIRFKYFVYEWDDEHLYLFMLDRKRQVTGETYTLEYVTGHMDEDGDLIKSTTQLQLKDDKFQSFYVPSNSDLLDVFLCSGDKKLRLDKSKLHTGIDINDQLSYMELSSTFNLDKHEGREMMSFNWLGTGLYEKYDTLYISLFNEKGKQMHNVTIHPERVDNDGTRIYDPAVKYFGYDTKTKQHKIVTMSNPAYVEIIANGYLPMLYKYPGAVDDEGVVNFENCQVALTMRKGNIGDGITISDQHFLNLNDEKSIIVRGGIDHRLCSIDAIDLGGKVEADTISYMDDCGNNFPKLLNNKVVEHYAEFETSFSKTKGGTAPDCELIATDIATGLDTRATQQTVDAVLASEFKSFTYDYFFTRFNLDGVIKKGTVAKLTLKAGNTTYNQFPFLRNMDFVRDEVAEDAEEEVNDKYVGDNQTENDKENGSRGFADAGYDLKVPVNLKFSFKPVSVSTSFQYNIRKNLYALKINLTMNRDEERPGEDKKYSDARKELKELEKYESFKLGDNSRANFVGGEKEFDDWIYDEIDDIFDISSKHIGKGWFGGAKLAFKMPPYDFKRFQVTEALGTIGYGIGMRWDAAENERFGKLASVLDKCSDFMSLSASFEASMQTDFGIKSFQDGASESMSSTNMGYTFQFSAKLAAGATMELYTPEKIGNFKLASVFNAQAGLRLGGKLGFRFGVEGPFDSYVPGIGASLIGVVIGQAYANIKTPIFTWGASAGFQLGGRVLIPDNDHNPFHNDFPYWLKDDDEARPMGLAYRPIPAPAASELCGEAIINDVALDADPEFANEHDVVYNDLGDASDYNDDKIIVANIADNVVMSKETVSVNGMTASNHKYSKRGNSEIIVFEQISKTIDNNEITEDNALSKSNEIQQATRICAAMRNGTGNWSLSDITNDDGYADLKPMVAMQEDGHASVIYQHGKFGLIDPSVSADTLSNIEYKGALMLRTFDGTAWSEPTQLFDFNLDRNHMIQQYDLLMRGDTTLVAAILLTAGGEPEMRYASKHISSNTVTYNDEALNALCFHMKRVGKHAIMAMIYNGSDSISDVYVKTITMTGNGDGRQGNDLGVGYSQPGKIKIITDSNSDDTDNFAILFTQMSNVYRGDEGEKKFAKKSTMMLNASRIFISNTLQITDPITLGSEMVDNIDGKERNLIITGFDGFLDDAKIAAVYTLADVEENGAVIMRNEKYFRNSCEWDVSYGSQALLGSSTLPVTITIKNTGTSAINGVTAVINGKDFPIEGAYVKPYDEQLYVVQYPIDDDFDGYITSQVAVEYLNTFRAQAHPRNKAMSFRRQISEKRKERVTLEDIECNVVSHSIEDGKNVFVVEVIDHAILHPSMLALVGIFPNSNGLDYLSGPNTIAGVMANDFETIGGVRKTYVTLELENVTEPLQAYITCHLLDLSAWENGVESMSAAVNNLRENDNPTLVNLFPTADPTGIVRIPVSEDPQGHKVVIRKQTDGVIIEGLSEGNTVKLFNTEGICVFKKVTATSSQFVPLSRHDVYLLSTEEENFKFRF